MTQLLGTVTRLPSGRHRLRIPLNGKRESFMYDTEEEAVINQTAMSRILGPELKEETVGKYIDAWLAGREKNSVVVDIKRDRGRFENWIKPHRISSISLRSLSRMAVLDWWEEVQDKCARQTALNALGVLRGALGRALDTGKIRTNPAAGLRARKEKRTEDPWTYLDLAEQDEFLRNCTPVEAIMVELAWRIGFRSGEFVSLRIRDVSETELVIRFGGKEAGKSTKSGKIRRVKLFGRARELFAEWKKILPTYCPKNPHGLAFPRPGGGFRAKEHFIARWERWKKITAHLGRRFRQHDLRHTCASALVSGMWERTWSLEEVCDFMDHEDIKTTQRYAHLAPSAKARAADEAHAAYVAKTEVQRTREDTPSKTGVMLLPSGPEQRIDPPLLHRIDSGSSVQDVPFVSSWAQRVTLAVAKGEFVLADAIIAEVRERLSGDYRFQFALDLAFAVGLGLRADEKKSGAL